MHTPDRLTQGPYYMPIYAGGPLIGCGAMGSFSGFIVYMVKGSGDPNYGRMVMLATHFASATVCAFGILFVALYPVTPCHEMVRTMPPSVRLPLCASARAVVIAVRRTSTPLLGRLQSSKAYSILHAPTG